MSGIQLKESTSASELIKDGWFVEQGSMWPGQQFCLEVESVLINGKSEYQDILAFKSTTYGNVLVLDGVIQLTERDEHAYQEMITHIPMFAVPNPKKVLIIGGGDGGVLREVAKHKSVETIHMCEIDQQVVEVSKIYFPSTSCAYSDPRLSLYFEDAAEFLKTTGANQNYDVIICDSSDPVGPAASLFKAEFYQNLYNTLAPHGIICTQGECQWLDLPLIRSLLEPCRKMYAVVKYAYTTIPTYPCGQIGFITCAKSASSDPAVPTHSPTADMNLKYYNSEIHPAAFCLPSFAKQALYDA